ncbi:MAG: ATP-binding protein [Bacteroidales bacterium]
MKQIVNKSKQELSGLREKELTIPVFSLNDLSFSNRHINFNGNAKTRICKKGKRIFYVNTDYAKFIKCMALFVLLSILYARLNGQYKHLKINDPTQKNYLNFYISEHKLNDNYIPYQHGTDIMKAYNGKSLPAKKNAAENIYVFRGFFTIDSLLKNEELAFHIGSLNYPCRIFCNGKLIHTLGSYKDHYTSRLRFASGILLSPSMLRMDSINELSIQIYQRYNESTALDKVFISSKRIVDKYTFVRNFFSLNLIQATLLVSVVLAMYFFFLVAFKKGMRNIKYLLFGICCITLGVGYCNISFSYSYADELIIYKISRVSLPVSCLFLIYYTISSTKIISFDKKSVILLAIPILAFIPFFVISESVYQIEKVFKVYVAFVNIPYLIFAFILGIISFYSKRSKSSFVFVVGFIILFVAVIADTRIYLMDLTPYTWGIPHGFLIFTIIIFFILSIEQTKAFNLSIERGIQLQEIKNGLELKVEERTSQLKVQNEKLLVQSKNLETANREISRQKEINSRFFANVSHELRTPLTLIIGYLGKLTGKHKTETNGEEPVNLIMNNAHRMKLLINQILDLSKLDEGKLKLELVENDIICFLKPRVYAFESLAENKGLKFNAHFHAENHILIFDPEKLEIVINNLISNAIKFTNTGSIFIETNCGKDFLTIRVKDTGIGINAEDKPMIFERFFQSGGNNGTIQTGTGIGLAVTRELVEMHHGTVTFKSEPGQGSEFIVNLPVDREIYKKDFFSDSNNIPEALTTVKLIKKEIPKSTGDKVKYSGIQVLIVEDNEELRKFLGNTLSDLESEFLISYAADGIKGYELATKEIPDLIIMDWMMPGMNGDELCLKTRENFRTSHIPIIMLTAKADMESKLIGLNNGADAYLAKPFDTNELFATIENLLKQRERLKEKYGKNILGVEHEVLDSVDDKFLRKIKTIIEKELTNPQLDVQFLSREMALSRSQLFRKLKALTDLTPNEYIRLYKLEKAHHRLTSGAGNVSEIAYDTGFENLSYFSKCFYEHYKIHPSELHKQAEYKSMNNTDG